MAAAPAVTQSAHNKRRWWLRPTALLFLVLLAWGGGFVWFLRLIAAPATGFGRADGIVVLTGGAERVEAGLRLLADGRANVLLISGIGGRADLAVLAKGSGVDTGGLVERITLGRFATSTHGNAREAASWVTDNHVGTLIVVTAWFHMPRALAELHRAMPSVVLLTAPVRPQTGRGRSEGGWFATIRLLTEEYSKYLIALTGLTDWLPHREAPASIGHMP